MYKITIQKSPEDIWVLTIGCQDYFFIKHESMMMELSAYLNNPFIESSYLITKADIEQERKRKKKLSDDRPDRSPVCPSILQSNRPIPSLQPGSEPR